MNRYGRMALDHTRQHRPKAFAALADPTGHFTRLGTEIEVQIGDLRDRMLGSPEENETVEEYRRRSYGARRQAEEIVLATLVWTDPEPKSVPDDEEVLDYRSRLAAASRTLAGTDRTWTETPAESHEP